VNGENGLQERTRQIERRMDVSERDRSDIWRHLGVLGERAAVLTTQLEALARDVEQLAEEIRWTRRALWAAAVSGLGVVVALTTLIASNPP
jgi:uncharacterized membrane protein